jgi:3-deoxy-D-manno-octulosonate 8-phosphate phosphatase (KDO 8-P phosphatase)
LGFEDIRAVVTDVDGVLTDGRITLASDGVEIKRFHVWDGTGIKYLLRSGIAVAFLTGRESDVVARRAEELGVEHVRQGAKSKLPAYESILADLGVRDEAVCYVGDDLPDLPVLRRAGVGVAVADARPEVIDAADHVTVAGGGEGALRELAETILKAQDRWAAIMSRYGD